MVTVLTYKQGSWRNVPVAAHFKQPNQSLEDLEVMGIHKFHRDDTTCRKHRKSYWMFELDTLVPSGLNIDD